MLFEIKKDDGQRITRTIARGYGGRSLSNYQGYRSISRESYINNFVVNRCMREQMNAINKLRFVVKRRGKGEGESEYVENHEVEKLLHKPNKDYGGNELLKRALIFWWTLGEIPLVIDKRTFASDIYIFRPDRLHMDLTGEPGQPYTNIYYQSSYRQKIDDENFLLVKNFNPSDSYDGLGRGLSPLKCLFNELDVHNALRDYKLSILSNGGAFAGVFILDDDVLDDDFDRFKSLIKQEYQGENNAGKYGVFSGLKNFIQTSAPPKDVGYNETEKQLIVNIHSGMGVDPILTGFNEYSSYNNKSEASKELYTKFAIPFLKMLADELTVYFCNRAMLKEDEFLEVDSSDVEELKKNKKELVEMLSKETALTENEKRIAQGKEPIKGLDIVIGKNYILSEKGELMIPMSFINANEPAPKETDKKSLFEHGDEGTWY